MNKLTAYPVAEFSNEKGETVSTMDVVLDENGNVFGHQWNPTKKINGSFVIGRTSTGHFEYTKGTFNWNKAKD